MRAFRCFCLTLLLLGSVGVVLTVAPGCKKPRIYGKGRFHDMSEIRTGMSANEVQRIMGSKYKTIWEEGLGGADMGRYIWEYEEGRVYFNTDGVYKVVPFGSEYK